MCTWLAGIASLGSRFAKAGAACAMLTLLSAAGASAQDNPAGEAALKLPDLSQVTFLGIDGHKLLTIGILFCIFGLIFGLLVLLVFFGWVASLAHEFFTSPTERTRFAARPGPMLYALLGLMLLGMFLVGIFIPAIGEITVFSTGGLKFRIWVLAW